MAIISPQRPAVTNEMSGASENGRPARRVFTAGSSLLGALPYFIFVTLFLIIPVILNFVKAFHNNAGEFSTAAITGLLEPQYLDAYLYTINLSLVTALIGGALGVILAWALATLERPAWLRNLLLSYSGVASQMGGIPLAFAFVAALGTQGLITVQLRDLTGFNLTDVFTLGSFWGLTIVYCYFQVPLMAVLTLPAIMGLRREWKESAEILGASKADYVRWVALPVIMPTVAGSLLLLFANSFSAYATAYALTGGAANLVPILVGFFISGNVFIDESFGAALVAGMIIVIAVALGLRSVLLRRATRWQKGAS